jgi:hypothetical protein
VVPLGRPSVNGVDFFNDYPTLGVDGNGVYFGTNVFGSDSDADVFSEITATRKSSLLSDPPSLGPVFMSAPIGDMEASPQPATNQDAVGPNAPAWFVASSPFTGRSTASGLTYRTLTWRAGTPFVSRTLRLSTPLYGMPPAVPALGSTTPIDTGDDRLLMATVRGGRLWTCRTVGTSRTGAAGATRAACEWLTLDISRVPARLLQMGRVFDPAATDPRSYFYPSIAVNGQGHAVIGFSGARATEFAGAYVTGRLAADPAGTMRAVTLLKPGEAAYTLVAADDPFQLNRWGDYSATTLDPNDEMTIWTVQEYARPPDPANGSIWGTWITQVLAPPPTIKPAVVRVAPGQRGVMLRLNGSGFFDPGAGFPNRLAVRFQAAGGGDGGVLNIQVRSVAAGHVVVKFDVAPGAAPGARDIVVTNPDGQAAVVAGGLVVGG